MNLSEEGLKYPDINSNPQTLCFNNFIENNDYENPLGDKAGQKMTTYFTIHKKEDRNYLNIIFNDYPIFDTVEPTQISFNFDYYIDGGSEKHSSTFKPEKTQISPSGITIALFKRCNNDIPLPELHSLKIANVNLTVDTRSTTTIYVSEYDYLVASFRNPTPMIYKFTNSAGVFLKNTKGFDYTLAYNFCKGPITKYLRTIIPNLNKNDEIYYLVCYSENICVSENISGFQGIIKSNTLEYFKSSSLTYSININNTYITKEKDNSLDIYSGVIGLPEDIVTPYSLMNILHSLNNTNKPNYQLLESGFVSTKIKKLSLFLTDSVTNAMFGPYEYFPLNQCQTIMLSNIDNPLQKYPDESSCPQSLLFTSFSSQKYNNNDPLVDENGNVFSIIITIFKGPPHDNTYDSLDKQKYIGYINMSTSGKLLLGKTRGLGWGPSYSDSNPSIHFEILLDGNPLKSPTVYTHPIVLSDGNILLDFFPINDKNMHQSMPFNQNASFSNLKIILNISDTKFVFTPAINNLTASFKNNPVIYTNFHRDSHKKDLLVNAFGNPLTYAFNYACDAANIKYLVAYGETISSETLSRKLNRSTHTSFDMNNIISYSETAYGVEFSPGEIPFTYNESNTMGYFPAFEGIMIYPYNEFSLTINNITIYIGEEPYVFRLAEKTELRKLAYVHSMMTVFIAPPYAPYSKRYYLISTNKEFPVQAPRPIDFFFSDDMDTTISIHIDSKTFPYPFSQIRTISDKITVNKKSVRPVFTISLSGSTYNISGTFKKVMSGDSIYFGLIEVQGLTPKGFRTFAAFYDRTYVVTPPL